MIVVILGFSGSGKTTLREHLLEKHSFLSKNTGYTTRPPREGEINGIDYHFVPERDFDANPNLHLKRQIGVNKYGIDIAQLDNKVLILDTNGLEELESKRSDVLAIYLNFSRQELITRLLERGDSVRSIQERFVSDERDITFEAREKSLMITEGSIEEAVSMASNFIEQQQARSWTHREGARSVTRRNSSFVEML